MWFKSRVFAGLGLAQKLGFPTVNLNSSIWPANLKTGVYACLVRYQDKIYKGALYFGPRLVLGQKHNVLEIYILDFKKEIYGEEIEFKIIKFLRPPQNFSDIEKLKGQLKKDKEEVLRVEVKGF